MENKDKDFEPCNIYEPGTAEYYRDVLVNISTVCCDYDGCDENNAKQLKELIDDISNQAKSALRGKTIYVKPKGEIIQ